MLGQRAEQPALAGYLFGGSPAMRRLQREAQVLARTSFPVLLLGETGTGKSALAEQVLHPATGRKGPFVAVDIAALPESLVAAELFGTARGAFSGAVEREGRVQGTHAAAFAGSEPLRGADPAETRRATQWLSAHYAAWRARGVTVLEPLDALGRGQTSLLTLHGDPLYFDSHHLSLTGARLVLDHLCGLGGYCSVAASSPPSAAMRAHSARVTASVSPTRALSVAEEPTTTPCPNSVSSPAPMP